MDTLTLIPADALTGANPPTLGEYGRRLLAEGDSWFTIGSLNPVRSSNLLLHLRVTRSTAIISCAYPGDTLAHMVDHVNDPWFDRLLRHPNFASRWEGILLSAGGNDLIDAAQQRPCHRNGQPAAWDERLLLTPEEALQQHPAETGAARWISEPGWQRLSDYLVANLIELVERRDEGMNRGVPLMLHTYSAPVVRPAGVVTAPQGWLWPAFEAFGIPVGERQAVSDLLFGRLRQLWLDTGPTLPQVRVFDSAAVPLNPARPGSTGPSGDWVNEIHLTPAGYAKLGAAMGPWMEAQLQEVRR
jgi:hypothetical protein